MYIRPDVRGFLAFLNAAPGPRMHEVDATRARMMLRSIKDIADLPIGALGTMLDLTLPGPAGELPARLFDPRATRDPGPLVLFFHGGGFVIGDLDTHASFCAEMARALDLPVLAIDYRLAPEHRWPAAPDDCEAAARWVASAPAALPRVATGLVLAGDSAGGNLAIIAAMALRDAPAPLPVLAHLLFYPATDGSQPYPSLAAFESGYLLDRDGLQWFADAYQADFTHARASPLLAALADMPPAMVLTASLDPIRDQGRAYAAALARAGVPVTFREAYGTVHGFITLRQAIPSAVADCAGAFAVAKTMIAESVAARLTSFAPTSEAR
ncbi:alpha/beta hydrolase [Sphingomonas sp. NFR15]|uniref:alpha/beta hydrolase n=1 Tax=Sphingomonas sp. NFR15 TaxID=1566282 RepID=UPI000B884DCF|nr:alpha/beta hydrolase [Sphingomonas sp. NFR15]